MIKRKIRCQFAMVVWICVFVFMTAAESNAAQRYNMSYIYYGNGDAYQYHVESTKNTLNEISPNYFNLDDTGNLELTLALDSGFIAEMRKKGIKVLPFLSNHWDRAKGIQALQNRERLSDQIANAIKTYQLDGVNVDIENVTEVERAIYTDFVRLLKEKLPEEKTVAVAVAANPYDIQKGWQASYDYKNLAVYSDYLMIMAYDESYTGGPAGPIASYSFVENTIKKALAEVPKEKIVLGIPFYGRYWKAGSEKGGYGLSNTDVVRLVNQYNGKVTFDDHSKSPKAVVTIGLNDTKPYILGKRLEAGTYTIWYENETSIKYKLDLVNKYDLKGTGSWSLGQETKDTWDYYGMWLNGHYYEDAQGHWAQGSIIAMAEKQWMTGISTMVFAPETAMTRAQAAAVLVRAWSLEEKPGEGVCFTDTANHWAENEIRIAAQNGVIFGMGNGQFAPDRQLTRQEMAVMLERMLPGLNDVNPSKNPFRDIHQTRNFWSYHAIVKLNHYGIFTGNPDGTFGPDKTTTRAQMAVLMDRIARFDDGNSSAIASNESIGWFH